MKRIARVAKPKDTTIQIRVTSAQKSALRAAAKKEGQDLSPWLRELVLRVAQQAGAAT